MKRCQWAERQYDLYKQYHDEEWGVPVHNDKKHFEFLILESAQAGLNWAIILKKRKGYQKAFAGFDAQKVARYDENKILELLQYDGIVRNQLKVRAAVHNARRFWRCRRSSAALITISGHLWGVNPLSIGGKK